VNVNRGWGARQAAEGTYGQFCGNNLDSDTAYIGIRWNGIGVVTNGGSAPRHNQVDANFAAGVPLGVEVQVVQPVAVHDALIQSNSSREVAIQLVEVYSETRNGRGVTWTGGARRAYGIHDGPVAAGRGIGTGAVDVGRSNIDGQVADDNVRKAYLLRLRCDGSDDVGRLGRSINAGVSRGIVGLDEWNGTWAALQTIFGFAQKQWHGDRLNAGLWQNEEAACKHEHK